MLLVPGMLILLGLGTALLSWNTRYRTRAVQKLAVDINDAVPVQYAAVLELGVARRTRAVAAGVIVTGIVLLALTLAAGSAAAALDSPWIPLALAFTFIAVALAAVELWWPATLHDSSARTARTSVPALKDYLPRYIVVVTWALTGLAWVILIGTLVLGQTRWFDASIVGEGPVPALGLAVTVLALLTLFAVQQVLRAPQPARDDTELYWQDAVRASTLARLHAGLALVSVLVLGVVAETLDAAASAIATASGQVGPDWTGAVLIASYFLAPLVLIAFLAFLLNRNRRSDNTHFRRRLWAGHGDGPGFRGASI